MGSTGRRSADDTSCDPARAHGTQDKAKKAGVLLAEILEKEVQGKRPVVLVRPRPLFSPPRTLPPLTPSSACSLAKRQIGYGPGASLIFSCLQHLHQLELGHLVYAVTLISLPDSPSPVAWAAARSVVSHELINAYSTNDWVLGIAARLYTLSTRIAGCVARASALSSLSLCLCSLSLAHPRDERLE